MAKAENIKGSENEGWRKQPASNGGS